MNSRKSLLPLLLVLLAIPLVPLGGCGPEEDTLPATSQGREIEAALADTGTILWREGREDLTTATGDAAELLAGWSTPDATAASLAPVTVDYPLDGSVYPPDLVSPTLLWHDDTEGVDAWVVEFAFADGTKLRALVAGPPPPKGEIDQEALGNTNEVYEPTPYQQSARSWRPDDATWSDVARQTQGQMTEVSILGVARAAPDTPLSRGTFRVETSTDPIGAPVFYRDVPLMPDVGEEGQIKPLSQGALPLIRWRLRDLARHDSRVVLSDMPTCANCHSFSLDGSAMGMDVDGPQGDKGAYMIAPVSEQIEVGHDRVISWNDFDGRIPGHKTIGFVTRLSPKGRYAVTTLNESLYVSNFPNYRFLQVFYPVGGILAWYDTETREMQSLPGADNPAIVHCNAVWTPDGETLVFSRAKARDLAANPAAKAEYPNDPREPKMQYDLYRMPFNGGKGGEAVPILGASSNGWSNTFPKVSPDGKWLVWTRCKNGQLMRPDGKLWIVPLEGGEAREMECNTALMNSWHSFSPNSRWMVWSSKVNTPYTQLFLTHIDEEGRSTPPILIPDSTAANRAVNIPEFLNTPYDGLQGIHIPAVNHHRHLRRAYELLEAQQFRESIPHFEAAAEQNPDMSRIYGGLAHAHAQLGNPDKAIDLYRRAIDLLEEYPAAHVGLGTLLHQMGRINEALIHLERGAELSPDLFVAHKNLGLALVELGRLDEGADHLLQALGLEKDDIPVHYTIATVYFEQGNFAKGLHHLREVLKLNPDSTRVRTLLAWHLATCPDAEVRDGEEAERQANQACERSRWERPEPMDALAAAMAEQGRFKEAAAMAERAVSTARRVNPSMVSDLEKRAGMYRTLRPYRGK